MNQNDIKTKSIENIEFFGNSSKKPLIIYVRKIGKIVAAIYLVTDVMDAAIPLTNSLRGQSLELMNEGYKIISSSRILADDLARLAMRLEQVMALVEIGSISHHIAPMNAEIIRSELSKIHTLVVEDISILREQERHIGSPLPMVPQAPIGPDVMSDLSFDELMDHRESKRHQNDIKTTLTTQNDKLEIINDIKTTNQNDTMIVDRKKEILNALKTRKFSTMNDIKSMISGYSEKTIQREIASLVEMGLVKREGNKRWAVYSVI